MLIFRWLILLLLLAAGVCFALYAGTGHPHYKRWGIVVLKWTLLAAFGLYAGLIVELVA
jgi:hypothetical protein